MTRCQIRHLSPGAESQNMQIVVEEVFMMAGYSERQLKKHKFVDKFRERLDAVSRLAYRIQEAVGEGIISDDFCISTVRVGEAFDAALMEDTFLEDGGTLVGQRVAGTTDLGVQTKTLILNKPKVVVSSAFP